MTYIRSTLHDLMTQVNTLKILYKAQQYLKAKLHKPLYIYYHVGTHNVRCLIERMRKIVRYLTKQVCTVYITLRHRCNEVAPTTYLKLLYLKKQLHALTMQMFSLSRIVSYR